MCVVYVCDVLKETLNALVGRLGVAPDPQLCLRPRLRAHDLEGLGSHHEHGVSYRCCAQVRCDFGVDGCMRGVCGVNRNVLPVAPWNRRSTVATSSSSQTPPTSYIRPAISPCTRFRALISPSSTECWRRTIGPRRERRSTCFRNDRAAPLRGCVLNSPGCIVPSQRVR